MMKGANLNPNLVQRLKDNTLQYGGIHYLDVANSNIGPREISALGDLIRANGTSGNDGSPIVSIDFTNNPICGLNSRGKGLYDENGLSDFCNSWIALGSKGISRLRKLNFSRCLLQVKGFTLLASLLTNGPSSIQELTLKNCLGNSECIEKLSEGLKSSRSLTMLDISENRIGSTGAHCIASVLGMTTRLKQVFMNSCDIGVEGSHSIFSSLQSNMTVEVLSCNDGGFGDDGCESIAAMLRSNQRLKHLDISENGIGFEGISSIFRAITKNRTLMVLGLQWNDLNNECARKIGEALGQNSTLKAIHILGTHIDMEGIQAIVNGSLVSSDRPIDLDLGFCYRPATKAKRERKVLKDEADGQGTGENVESSEGNIDAAAGTGNES